MINEIRLPKYIFHEAGGLITFLEKYIQLVYAQGFKFLFTFVFLHQSNNILGEGRRVSITAGIVHIKIINHTYIAINI